MTGFFHKKNMQPQKHHLVFHLMIKPLVSELALECEAAKKKQTRFWPLLQKGDVQTHKINQ